MKLVAKKAIVWSTVGTVGASAVVLPVVLTPILSNYRTMSDSRELRSKTMGPIVEQIVATNQPRTPNKDVYKSTNERPLLIEKYENAGFRYPAYNFQYNHWNPKTNKENRIFVYNDNGVTKELDGLKAIYLEEKFPYKSESFAETKINNDTRWASASFVLDEIKHERLKKHPATENLYRDMVGDDVKAITKRFILPSTIFGTNETGLYIPPGEVAEITFSDEMHEWIQKNQVVPFGIKLNNNTWDGVIEGKNDQNQNDPNQWKYRPMGGRYPFMRTEFWSESWKNGLENDPKDPTKKIFPKTFKFGSPFGGIINIFTTNNINGRDVTLKKEINGIKKTFNFDFTISGAVPTMHYVDGVTTESEWNQMIQEVYDKKRAPFFTANTLFYSFGFPFESKSETDYDKLRVLVHDKDLNGIQYPRKTFRKWFDFLFNSWYHAGGERIPHRKIDMQFSYAGDVWGGAAGWGGGDALYCDIGWAAFAFLSEVENWSYGGNWGVYHEINHNFQQDGAFFRAKGHGQTNEVTMGALAQLNDTLRGRTEYDPLIGAGDWAILSNYFGLMNSINSGDRKEEYGYYQNLMYTFGPYNYLNYIRDDVKTHWCSDEKWTGQSEIINLSNYFKINLVDATYDYIERNVWPKIKEDVVAPTSNEQQQINEIRKNYKMVDFVSNLYAAGSYVYDNEIEDYYYGGDSNPVFTIPFGDEYVFDMLKNTNHIKFKDVGSQVRKDEISFSNIEFDQYSKNGAKIVQDEKDPFKIKYVPNLSNIKEVGLEDEFDVALIVDPTYAKKYNSVPKYKWKIKVRQEVNTPTIEYFTEYSRRDFKDSLKLIDDYDKGIDNELKLVKKVPYMTSDLREFLNGNTKQHELSRVKFKFVVPETREYNISFICDDQIRFKIRNLDTNEELDYQHPWYRGTWTYIKDAVDAPDTAIRKFNWKKGQIIDFDVVCINTNGGGNYTIRMEKVDPITKIKTEVNWFKNSLVSNIFEINQQYFGLKAVNDFLTNIKYAYEFRKLDYSRLPFINARFLEAGQELRYLNINPININNFDIYYQWPNAKPEQAGKNDNLKDDNTVWEDWSLGGRPAIFYFNFNSPQNLSGLNIKHRTNNWQNERPTRIKVVDITNQNTVLFEGEYKDRDKAETFLDFDKKAINTSLIKVELANEKEGSKKCLSLMSITPYQNKYLDIRLSNSFAYDNSKILYSGKWEIYQNEIDGYQSNMNNGYIKSNPWTSNEIEFNIIGNGFSIVGPVGPQENAIFDVYINGELYKSNLSNNAKDFDSNANLCYYLTETLEPQKLKVKVVVKKGSLIFNYLNTYGNYSNLYIDEKK